MCSLGHTNYQNPWWSSFVVIMSLFDETTMATAKKCPTLVQLIKFAKKFLYNTSNDWKINQFLQKVIIFGTK